MNAYLIFLKTIEIIGLIGFGIVMRFAIDEMQLPPAIIPIFKHLNTIGVITMLYCSVIS